MATVYRVQPIGLDLAGHRSETSNGDDDSGVHVFESLEHLYHGVYGWCSQDWQPEIVTIECDADDLADNGDYEGLVLVGNRGTIVGRNSWPCWDSFAEHCRENK